MRALQNEKETTREGVCAGRGGHRPLSDADLAAIYATGRKDILM